MATPNEAKVGFATLCDNKSSGETIQLQLTPEVLILLREEYVHRDAQVEENGNDVVLEQIRTVDIHRDSEGGLGLSVKGGSEHRLPALISPVQIRTVDIHRDSEGGLGLSVKGGSEHRLPALVSRIFPGQAAARTNQLFIGDAILKVNDVSLESFTHDQVIETLRNAGDVVTLTVKHFKPAAIFLNKSGDSVSINDNERNVYPPGVIQPRFEKQWVVYSSIPLLYAYLTRYVGATDQLRTNAFELVGIDGNTSGVLQFDDSHSLAEWIAAITNNILQLLNQMIMYMGWAQERASPGRHSQAWKPKFVALKGPDVFLFEFPPMQTKDWVTCDTVFHVYECLYKVLQDSELMDDKQHCCSIQTGSKETIYLSLESRSDLLQLEKAWYRTNHSAVMKIKTKTFGCTYRGRLSGLTLDMDVGFSLYDSETKAYLWNYKFSKLKGSSDDGRQRLKLHFHTDIPGQIETREVDSSNLQTLLYSIHAFLSAKLASVDPSFLKNY